VSALADNTTANFAVAIGRDAMRLNTTGTNNTAIGYEAGYDGTTASYNVFLGTQAGRKQTTGQQNIAIGNAAFYQNTTGVQNVAVGHNALRYATTSNRNTMVGYLAGQQTTTAGANVAIGDHALQSKTSSGNDNVAIGTYAGNGMTSGGNNTFVGASSGQNITTGSNNTILGRYNGNSNNLDLRTSSGNIVLSDGTGVPRMHYTSAHNAWNAYAGDNALRVSMDHDIYISLANNSTFTVTDGMCGATLVCVYERANGDGAVYWANYRTGTYLQQSMAVSYGFTTTGGNAGTINLYKSGASHTLTLENKTGATRTFCVSLFGSALMKT
jgi:hypothetical protein